MARTPEQQIAYHRGQTQQEQDRRLAAERQAMDQARQYQATIRRQAEAIKALERQLSEKQAELDSIRAGAER